MPSAEMFVAAMLQRFSSDARSPRLIKQGDIAPYTGTETDSDTSFYDEVGRVLAQGFYSSDLSFEFCDAIVNGLYGVLIEAQFREPQPSWPNLFYEVFLAFDEGEYQHRDDTAAVNPIASYTKPAIERIVAAL